MPEVDCSLRKTWLTILDINRTMYNVTLESSPIKLLLGTHFYLAGKTSPSSVGVNIILRLVSTDGIESTESVLIDDYGKFSFN